jgi:hypothetical protein
MAIKVNAKATQEPEVFGFRESLLLRSHAILIWRRRWDVIDEAAGGVKTVARVRVFPAARA